MSEPARTEFAIDAVTCADAPPFPESVDQEEILKHMIEEDTLTQGVAPHFAGIFGSMCHHWKAEPSERFTGPWNNTLSNPIVIIGNIADPITPLMNAKATNHRLGNSSSLIIQNSYGHCSTSTASLCTANALRAYFIDNVVPPDGMLCQPTETIFPASTSDDSLWVADAEHILTAEDVELLEAVKGLGVATAEYIGRGRGKNL